MYRSASQQETAAHSSTDTLRRVSGQRAEFLDMVVGRVRKPQGKCSSLGLLTSPRPEEVRETGCWNPGEKHVGRAARKDDRSCDPSAKGAASHIP